MKPPRFEYHDPETVTDTVDLLSQLGDEAKILAGGQSLVPLLNFRLARPEHVVDVNGVAELDYLRRDGDTLRIGALTRHSALERSQLVAASVPLLTEAIKLVGHVQIRNRGTVGGSVAHADPAAELPVALTALGARFQLRSRRSGARSVGADELFVTHLTTCIEPDELLTEIEVPVPPPGTVSAFVEFSRRHGDFALGGAAVLATPAADGTVAQARIALLAAADTPLRAVAAEQALVGARIDADTAARIGGIAVEGLSPTGDLHGSTEYRLHLLSAMVKQALLKAGTALGAAA